MIVLEGRYGTCISEMDSREWDAGCVWKIRYEWWCINAHFLKVDNYYLLVVSVAIVYICYLVMNIINKSKVLSLLLLGRKVKDAKQAIK